MSLVLARLICDEIRILCDSKVTNPETIRSGPMTDILKAIILRADLCVCFAGNVRRAEVAIEALRSVPYNGNPLDLEKLLIQLVKDSREGVRLADNGVLGTDYIVATLRPSKAIHRIKDGILEQNLTTAWVGDYSAFSAFQEYYHSEQENWGRRDGSDRFYIVGRMMDAFQNVIFDSRFPAVGNFLISTTSKPAGGSGFTYLPSAIGVGFGNAAQGGYCYSMLTPKAIGTGAIGLYFYQGRFGALMYPERSASAVPYPNVDLDTFILRVKNDFGIELWRFGLEMESHWQRR